MGHFLELQNDLQKATVGFLCLPEIVKNILYPTQFFWGGGSPNALQCVI